MTQQFGPSYTVHKTGIHISSTHPWLQMVLFRILQRLRHDEMVFYKYAYQRLHARICSSITDGKVTLKKTRNYYYQVQGQLQITQFPWCDFLIWTPHGTALQWIKCDDKLWTAKYPKLLSFYREYQLQLLSNSTARVTMDIDNYYLCGYFEPHR